MYNKQNDKSINTLKFISLHIKFLITYIIHLT